MAFGATKQNGDATTLKLAAHLEGSGMRSRTNQSGAVRVTLPELMQAVLEFADSPYDSQRPAVTLGKVRPLRQRRGSFERTSFGEGL